MGTSLLSVTSEGVTGPDWTEIEPQRILYTAEQILLSPAFIHTSQVEYSVAILPHEDLGLAMGQSLTEIRYKLNHQSGLAPLEPEVGPLLLRQMVDKNLKLGFERVIVLHDPICWGGNPYFFYLTSGPSLSVVLVDDVCRGGDAFALTQTSVMD